VGISKYYLIRLFREHVGQTPGAYLREKRMRHALDLISYTSYSVKQIAGMVGYRNYVHFIAAFRKRFGRSPAKARATQGAG
jgi:AraC-like DNA-binding protein